MDHFHNDNSIFRREHWFKFAELYQDQVKAARDGAVFVEVGCYEGRSTAFLAVEIDNSGKNIALHCIDLWRRSPYADFERNLKPVWHRITRAYQEDSVAAARHFADGSVDFVFLDAGHFEHNVVGDIRAWWPKLKPGGLLAGDDYWWYPDGDPVHYTVWAGVQRCFKDYEVTVRNHWAIWHVRKSAHNRELLPEAG